MRGADLEARTPGRSSLAHGSIRRRVEPRGDTSPPTAPGRGTIPGGCEVGMVVTPTQTMVGRSSKVARRQCRNQRNSRRRRRVSVHRRGCSVTVVVRGTFVGKCVEPTDGFEPSTCCLRNSCSATELRWLVWIAGMMGCTPVAIRGSNDGSMRQRPLHSGCTRL